MKKLFVLACFISVIAVTKAQPKIFGVSFPEQVAIYGLYEISFSMGDYENMVFTRSRSRWVITRIHTIPR